ncbi:MAG: hypothetical protein R6W93_03415 [Candidatus Limnocylindrales bacterium]
MAGWDPMESVYFLTRRARPWRGEATRLAEQSGVDFEELTGDIHFMM